MNYLKFLIALAVVAVSTEAAQAQLFGNRSIGRPLSRQMRPGSFDNSTVGQIEGSERFIRGNRDRSAFVGADQGEAMGFIGSQQGRMSGRIASSIGRLTKKTDQTFEINRPIGVLSRGDPYPARLVLSPDFEIQPASNRLEEIVESLNRNLPLSSDSRIEVSVVKRMAILQGEVVSARERDLAEILLLFEPGIDSVQNDLAVNDVGPDQANPPSVLDR